MFLGFLTTVALLIQLGADHAFHRADDLLFYPAVVEERATIRVKTDRTRTDESGETVPVYEMKRPEPGTTFLHIELLLASQTPRLIELDEVTLVDEDGRIFRPETAALDLRLAPRETVEVDRPVDLQRKIALDLVYIVPASDWASLVLAVQNEPLTALASYVIEGSPVGS